MNDLENYMDIILRHVRACGPVSHLGLLREVRIQAGKPKLDDWELAPALNKLLALGKIELYDDCQTFVVGSE